MALFDPRRFGDDVERFFNDGFGSLTLTGGYNLNMYETDNEIVVEVEAPMYKPEQVDISIEDQTLTISGHYKNRSEDDEDVSGKRYHYREIVQQSFNRTVTLPVRVKAENAEASFKDGIITVNLPKAEEVKPKKIAVKTTTAE